MASIRAEAKTTIGQTLRQKAKTTTFGRSRDRVIFTTDLPAASRMMVVNAMVQSYGRPKRM